MKRIKSLLNKMSSPMRPPAGLGYLRLIKSFVSKVFSLFITTQSAEDSRQRHSGMTALLDVKAFTLVELLVVVLIIGVLSAIAIPMYQGAVDKSHWSTMLPASKAIKDAEEAFKMTNGEYSDTMEHLDVQISNNDLTFTLNTPNNLADPNVIRVTNSKLSNVRLASYLDQSPMFGGQLHCEAKNEGSTPNERGQRLCEKLLNGQYLKTTDDGYTRYLLDQDIDGETCKNATLSWSTSKTKCYKTTTDRCDALNIPVLSESEDQCGYKNARGITIGAEGTCQGGWGGCSNLIVNDGGSCKDTLGGGCKDSTFNSGSICLKGCTNSTFNNSTCQLIAYGDNNCSSNTFNEGSKCYSIGQTICQNSHFNSKSECIATEGFQSCRFSTFSEESKCVGNVSNSCYGGTFNSGSECIASASQACGRSTFKTGSKCIANAPGTCRTSGDWLAEVTCDGGCCEGPYCPKEAPSC